ncbi:hypothetical protein PIB30_075120 [Stylosanthes scabra]|uniref:Aminotransferase-like plant mobile domain-containing protein n=1 Tax=Stylosanthes scabra TaxID=79078 RepID=A0ABU6YN14_9FABA|nr:hypothetical protein [Stylosanthes scabra]
MGRLVGAPQPARDQQEGRLLRWRARLDRVSVEQFRWTPYDSPEMQALIPDWMRAQPEVHTWRSAVPVVCFNFVHMHHIDRVIRQYGGEQPVPRLPQYYEWFARVARRGRFLSRAADLADPRWTMGPAGIPVAAAHPRDDLVMPDDAPAPRRRQPQVPRPRQRPL